jgi:cytochrome b
MILPATIDPTSIVVWDRGVRIFHWGLVLTVAVAAITGFLAPPNWLDIHLIAGVAVACLVMFRFVWGWTGSTYARFRSFAVSPALLRRHFTDITEGRVERHLGHNQFGALMVYGILAVLTLVSVTGLVALGGAIKQGPLAFATSFAAGKSARQIHEWLAIGILLMVAAHLAGVAFESWRSQENLVRAMITGRKAVAPGPVDAPDRARPSFAVTILTAVAVFVLTATILLSKLDGLGVPPFALDRTYTQECGSCHLAYPPSLAGAAIWTAVMGGLTNHFGENASLDAATTTNLGDWLRANSGEHWDTRAANEFRLANPTDPQRITATASWVRMHSKLPDAIFKSPKVGAKGACATCHRDAASGRFDPQDISTPKEARL